MIASLTDSGFVCYHQSDITHKFPQHDSQQYGPSFTTFACSTVPDSTDLHCRRVSAHSVLVVFQGFFVSAGSVVLRHSNGVVVIVASFTLGSSPPRFLQPFLGAQTQDTLCAFQPDFGRTATKQTPQSALRPAFARLFGTFPVAVPAWGHFGIYGPRKHYCLSCIVRIRPGRCRPAPCLCNASPSSPC
jgi:hypothetical protein